MFSVMMNGSLEGFFPSRKGLCQGDPLSPFLFVIIMEVLSQLLNRSSENFNFYDQCERTNLTHLSFADDLMIFCGAGHSSL